MEGTALADDGLDSSALMDPMEDLFGDAAEPLPARLVRRLAESQRTACCTTLAYSPSGFIAFIAHDGRTVNFSAIKRVRETGSWRLSEPSTQAITAPASTTFVHLAFSPSGIDLAVVAGDGAIHYCSLSAPVGHMIETPFPGQASHVGDAGGVIGMHWLPVYPTDFRVSALDPPNFLSGFAVLILKQAPITSASSKRDHGWHTTMLPRENKGPKLHHPVDRAAFFWLNSSMHLTLAYQQVGDGWHRTDISIESIATSEEFCTHASFCDNGADLLLAAVDQSSNLKVYKVMVQWNLSQVARPQGTLNLVQPHLEVVRLAVAERIEPQHAMNTRLSVLKLLPPSTVDSSTSSSHPVILGLFTYAAIAANIASHQQNAFSVVARWHVEVTTPTLHDSFGKLKTSPVASLNLQGKTVLSRQGDVVIPKVVLSLDHQTMDSNVVTIASDGTIDFRDRPTFNSIVYNGDTTFVSGLAQTGFEHTPSDHAIAVAASSDGSAIVYQPADASPMRVKFMVLSYGWQPMYDGLNDPASLVEAAIVCLARQYAMLANRNHSTDEVLALLPPDLSEEQKQVFDRSIYLAINRPIEISTQAFDKQRVQIMKEPLLPRAQSAQLVSHDVPGAERQHVQFKLAWCLMNLKSACAALASLRQGQDASPVGFIGTVLSLRGVACWSIDLLLFVVDGLFAFDRASKSSTSPILQTAQNHLETTQSPVLLLLLSSYPRVFLKLLALLVQQYVRTVGHATQRATFVADRHQLLEVYEYATKRIPVKLAAFDALISDVDSAVREQQVSDQRRTEIELRLLCHAQIAPELSPVLERLVQTALPNVSDAVDVGGLNTSWTDIRPRHRDEAFDVITKTPISRDAKRRHCRRCGSVTEAVSVDNINKGLATWLNVAKRHCVCGNYWLLP